MGAEPTRLDSSLYERVDAVLDPVDKARLQAYPGTGGSRQPVHTVYVPADRFRAGIATRWGEEASELLKTYAPDPEDLSVLLDVSVPLAAGVYPRVAAKLASEPIEDLRIDFEDGYGVRPDADEDAAVLAAAAALREDTDRGRVPRNVGVRVKSLEGATRHRGMRSLDLFLTALTDSGALPDGFVITLPKVTAVAQVEVFADICTAWEHAGNLAPGTLRFEIQVETPQAILGADGTATVARMVHAGRGRITGLHYGTYDYSAACGVSAAQQSMEHPVADHAKAVMQLAAAATGVRISDGSTNVLPIGAPVSVMSAWRLHGRLVRRSLERAYYQGWDLHPGQLVTRFAATFAFYREGFPGAADRLRNFLANTSGAIADEPATAQAMAALLVRGLHSGALDAGEVEVRTGIDTAALEAHYRRRVG